MKQSYFFRIDPAGLAGNCKNHHLLHVELDTETDKFFLPDGKATLCGCCERNKTVKLDVESQWLIPEEWLDDYDLYDEEEYRGYLRAFLAEEQNAGVNYCARCVAHFYQLEDASTE